MRKYLIFKIYISNRYERFLYKELYWHSLSKIVVILVCRTIWPEIQETTEGSIQLLFLKLLINDFKVILKLNENRLLSINQLFYVKTSDKL